MKGAACSSVWAPDSVQSGQTHTDRETYVTGMTSQEVSAIVCVCVCVCVCRDGVILNVVDYGEYFFGL